MYAEMILHCPVCFEGVVKFLAFGTTVFKGFCFCPAPPETAEEEKNKIYKYVCVCMYTYTQSHLC